MRRDKQFWRIALGCAGQWTTVEELAELYGRTRQSFYGHPLEALVEEGVLQRSERMTTMYRTDLYALEPAMVADYLDSCSHFLSHEWLETLVPDAEIRAERAEEIYRTLVASLRESAKDAHRLLAAGDGRDLIRELTSARPEAYHPHYFEQVRLFHILTRLNGCRVMEQLMDGGETSGATGVPAPEDGVTERYLEELIGVMPGGIEDKEIERLMEYLE